MTAAFSYLIVIKGAQSDPDGGIDAILDLAGKVWNSPNTTIGLVYGTAGFVVGEAAYAMRLKNLPPSIGFGDNPIQFSFSPFAFLGAITIGNAEVFWHSSI